MCRFFVKCLEDKGQKSLHQIAPKNTKKVKNYAFKHFFGVFPKIVCVAKNYRITPKKILIEIKIFDHRRKILMDRIKIFDEKF